MRDRLYTDTMQQIYSSVTKVLVDSKQGSNLLYLPLDKIMSQVAQTSAASADVQAPAANNAAPAGNGTIDSRSRDAQRSRDRDPR
jgi:membrane protease subunit HflK